MPSIPIKTRILIISDTHGAEPYAAQQAPQGSEFSSCGFQWPLPTADVLIHCGDLTKESLLDEYKRTFDVIRKVDAKLKLVIAGNHDCALDQLYGDQWLQRQPEGFDKEVLKSYPSLAKEMVRELREDGVQFLDEGTHAFVLENGARLRVFASPMSPGSGIWAFQYRRGDHIFEIPAGMDVAMTHGPPANILDHTIRGSAGCEALLQALATARPRIHCFGHIHEGWGAKLVTWNDATSPSPINEAQSVTIEDLRSLDLQPTDDFDTGNNKAARRRAFAAGHARPVSLCSGDAFTILEGKQTLFVNAAIMDLHYQPNQLPWLVDLELPLATLQDRQAARERAAAAAEASLAPLQLEPGNPVNWKIAEIWNTLKRQ